ncbi:MAG: ScyD/ScyE family protein [Anaerolineae bacterium]|nr:ScyD/ScyE family protein [Anaerolineae bacterium]
MRNKMIFVLIAIFVLALPVLAQPPAPELTGDIVIEGLNGPQGLHVDSDGNVWVIDSGMGGEEAIQFLSTETGQLIDATLGQTSRIVRLGSNGEVSEYATLPSIAAGEDFIGGARLTVLDGTLYATVGSWQILLGEEPTIDDYSVVVSVAEDGSLTTVADFWSHELVNNPDGTDNIESHPYGITVGPNGLLFVADAAANALISVDPETSETTTIAVFEGMPGVFPNPLRGGQLLTDPVPTGVVAAEDGTIYVSLLSGAPFIPGSAKVVQVAADGTVSDFALGHTMLTDLKMGPDGNLYAVSFGMFTEEGPVFNSGSVVRILEDGTSEVVLDGLPFATALAFDSDGNGYVAVNGVAIPNAGMVVYYEGLTSMDGMPMPEMGGM